MTKVIANPREENIPLHNKIQGERYPSPSLIQGEVG